MTPKKDAEPISTDDFWYDLFDRGYIKPEDILEPEDAERVSEAVHTLESFKDDLDAAGLIEWR